MINFLRHEDEKPIASFTPPLNKGAGLPTVLTLFLTAGIVSDNPENFPLNNIYGVKELCNIVDVAENRAKGRKHRFLETLKKAERAKNIEIRKHKQLDSQSSLSHRAKANPHQNHYSIQPCKR